MSVATLIRSSVASEPVPDELIQRCMTLYRPEYVHIRDARYGEGVLTATFEHYPLDIHRKPLDHLSRVQIVHYIGQAAFVIGVCLAGDGTLAPLTEGEYLRLVEAGSCTFHKLELNLRRFLPNTGGTTIRMSCDRVHRANLAALVSLSFTLNDGACYGVARGVVPAAE